MILSFADDGTRKIFDGRATRQARKKCPHDLWAVARRKLDMLNQAHEINDLRRPPGNRLERLKGERKDQYSIRINIRYRICFEWTRQGPKNVEIIDYH